MKRLFVPGCHWQPANSREGNNQIAPTKIPHRGFKAIMYLNIKLQVFRLGFHQIDIAKALGINESVLSKIIHGYREPSKTQRMLLARYLNAEESWLFEKYDLTLRPAGAVHSLPPREGGGPS